MKAVFSFVLVILLMISSVQAEKKLNAYYIPYEKLDEVIENDQKGVFVPYTELLKLWEAAGIKEKSAEKPPVDAFCTRVEITGSVKNQQAVLKAILSVQVLAPWAKLPLSFKNTAFTSFTAPDSDIYLSSDEHSYYAVFKRTGIFDITAEFSVPVTGNSQGNSLQFSIPDCSVKKLDISVPGENEFDLAGAGTGTVSESNGMSRFSAFLSQSDVTLSWHRRARREDKLIYTVSQSIEHYITEKSVKTTAVIDCTINQGAADSLKIQCGAASVIAVKGEGVETFRPFRGGVEIKFFAAVDKSCRLTLETEQKNDGKDIIIPVFSAADASRQEGTITVFRDEEIKCKVVSETGAIQTGVDKKQKDSFVPGFAFSFFSAEYTIKLRVERVVPYITAVQNLHCSLNEGGTDIWCQFSVDIKRAGVFSVVCLFPRELRFAELSNNKLIEDSHVESAGRLVINFSEKIKGQVSFSAKFFGTSKSTDQSFFVPEFKIENSASETGYVGIKVPEEIKINTSQLKGLIAFNVSNFNTGKRRRSAQDIYMPDSSDAGFRFFSHPYEGQLALSRKESSVSAKTALLVNIGQAQLSYSGSIDYTILYSGVNELFVQVDSDIAPKMHFDGAFINEKKTTEKDGKTLFTIVLQRPVTGAYSLSFSAETASSFDPQKPEFTVPRIMPENVINASGFIGLAKDQVFNVEASIQGAEETDVKDLLAAVFKNTQVFKAFRYMSGQYSLKLQVSKPDFEEIPDCIIKYAYLETVIGQDSVSKNLYTAFIQNNGRQFIHIKLPAGFKILALEIDGERQRFSKPDEQGYTAIKVPPQSERVFSVLSLQYEVSGGSMGLFGFYTPGSPLVKDISVSKIDWQVYTPGKYSNLYFGGNADRYAFTDYGYASRIKGQAKSSSSLYIEKTGRRYNFSRLSQDVHVWFFYISENLYLFIKGVLCVLLFMLLIKSSAPVRYSIWTGVALILVSVFFESGYDDALSLFRNGVVAVLISLVYIAFIAYRNRPKKPEPEKPVTEPSNTADGGAQS